MKKIFLLATLLIIFIFPLKANAEANWIWVYSDEYSSIWIDNNSINRDSNVFFAYFKYTYSDAGVSREFEIRRSIGLPVDGYYNLSHSIKFVYFKNENGINYSASMEYVDYDKNGKVLDRASWNDFDWRRIILDSIGGAMYDAAYARLRGK